MAFSKRGLANNSAGLGGTIPAGRTFRFSVTPESVNSEKISLVPPERYLVIPSCLCEKPKCSAKRGLRISSPNKTTFLPSNARLTAKLTEVKVLPSPGLVEVNRMTLWSSLLSMNWRLVRRLRKVSAIMLFSFSRTTMVRLPSISFCKGISPRIGIVVSFSTS